MSQPEQPHRTQRYALMLAAVWTLLMLALTTFSIENHRAFSSRRVDWGWQHHVFIGHAIMWLVGLSGIAASARWLLRSAQREAQTLQRLRESELRYRSLFEQSNDAIFIVDLQGRPFEMNQRAVDMLGYTLAEINDIMYSQIVSESELRGYLNILSRLQRGEQIAPYERVFRRKDGKLMTAEVSIAAIRDEQGRVLCFQSVFRDISQRRAIEEALYETNRQYDELVKNIPAMVYRVRLTPDLRYSFDYISPRAKEFTGFEAEDILREPHIIRQNFSPEVDAIHWERMIHSMKTLTPYEFEGPITVNGEKRWVRLQSHPRQLANGDVVWDGLHLDITEQKQAQQRAIDLLIEKERRQFFSAFIRNIAHEFRTPLAVIGSDAYLMARSEDMQYRQTKADHISTQIQRITRLVDMLLLMSKLENTAPVQHSPIELPALLQAVCHEMSQRCAKQHHLICQCSDQLPPILGDADDLPEVFRQIIENACHFTPTGSKVTVRASVVGSEVAVDIEDEGQGIPEQNLPHIFEAFWRHDAHHSTPGLGLGLTIARKIVHQHHGRIEVTSQMEKGSCFRVLLPTAES